jgi:hypothetical protein
MAGSGERRAGKGQKEQSQSAIVKMADLEIIERRTRRQAAGTDSSGGIVPRPLAHLGITKTQSSIRQAAAMQEYASRAGDPVLIDYATENLLFELGAPRFACSLPLDDGRSFRTRNWLRRICACLRLFLDDSTYFFRRRRRICAEIPTDGFFVDTERPRNSSIRGHRLQLLDAVGNPLPRFGRSLEVVKPKAVEKLTDVFEPATDPQACCQRRHCALVIEIG